MALLAQLWGSGISAQMLPREAPSLAEQYEYADACGAKWLVIIGASTVWRAWMELVSQPFLRLRTLIVLTLSTRIACRLPRLPSSYACARSSCDTHCTVCVPCHRRQDDQPGARHRACEALAAGA